MSSYNESIAASFTSSTTSSNNNRKRQLDDFDNSTTENILNSNISPSTASYVHKRHVINHTNNLSSKRFRSKQQIYNNPSFINQEPVKLNINRILDILSKEQLTHLLMKSIQMEPRLEKFLIEESELKFFQNNGTKFKLLREKLISHFDKLVSLLPFERDHMVHYGPDSENIRDCSDIFINDYSFEKVKPTYLNYLNLIYDYNEYALKYSSLNMEIWNLLEISLKILISLPKFENKVNNYYKNYLIEKLDNLIVSVLIQQTLENDSEKSKTIEMIINMNKVKLDKSIESLGVDKFANVKKFIDKLCGTGSTNMKQIIETENVETNKSSNGLNYINSFLQQQHDQTSFFQQQLHSQSISNQSQNFNQNQNMGFHNSILITGVSNKEQQNTTRNACHTSGSDCDKSNSTNNNNSEYGISNPDVYFT